jgi:23S rRNA (guanosine2251-2'-O)-methyltransferase
MSSEQPDSGRKRGRRRRGPGSGPRDGQPQGRPNFEKRPRSGQPQRGPGQQRGPQQRGTRQRAAGGQSPRTAPKGQLPEQAIYGVNAVTMALQQDMLKQLYFETGSASERVTQLHALAQEKGINTLPLTKAPWTRVLAPDHLQGVAGIIHEVHTHYLEDVVEGAKDDSCILVLDRVQDPQNLGAILRTAAAAGVDAVVLPKAGGAPITPAVHRASAGMSMRVRIVEDENLARALDFLKEHGYWAIGCASGEDGIEPEDATTFEYPRKRVLVMGNEAEGLRRLVRESCDYIVRIPMDEGVESLNVSVATAVVLYLAKADLAKAELESEPEEA